MKRFFLAALTTLLCSDAVSAQAPVARQSTSTAITQSTATPELSSTQQFGDEAKRKQITRKGIDYLLEKGQAEDGSFSKQLNPAITSLCLSALLANDVAVSDPRVQKGLAFVESHIQPDGGIYKKGSNLRNYETSVAIMCLVRARDALKKTSASAEQFGKYDVTIERAAGFLKGLQWDEGENHGPESDFHGGQGYGSHQRPDLSNTQFFLDALKASGEPVDSDAMKKALIFVSRCQNLPSEHNEMDFAKNITPGEEGGMIYTPAGGGETKVEPAKGAAKAGATKVETKGDESVDNPNDAPQSGLRSYASMTYAGLKSFLYAGVSKDDQRVQAAMTWISKHYDLESNPGLGQQGLFYYYHVFGKTMNAMGENEITDAAGVKHDWRKDLTAQLAKRQKADGSWTNAENSARWYEGDPNLVTAYSLLALSYCE